MSSITDMVQEHLGDTGVAQLTQHLGVDPATAQAAIAAALPMLVGAMSGTTSQPGGAPMSPAAATAGAGGLLGSLLGGRHADMSQQVSKSSGLDMHQAEKALLFLAPIVMASLARKRQQDAVPPAAPGAAPQPDQPQESAQQGLGGVLGAVERIFRKGS
jgi:hypothetical protein